MIPTQTLTFLFQVLEAPTSVPKENLREILFLFLYPPDEKDKITHLLDTGNSGREGRERGTPGIMQKKKVLITRILFQLQQTQVSFRKKHHNIRLLASVFVSKDYKSLKRSYTKFLGQPKTNKKNLISRINGSQWFSIILPQTVGKNRATSQPPASFLPSNY